MNNEKMMMMTVASNNNSNKESEKKMMNKFFSKKISTLIPLTNNINSDIQFAFNYMIDDKKVYYTTFLNNHLWVSRASTSNNKNVLQVVENGKIVPHLFTIDELKTIVKVNAPVSYNMNVKNHHIKFNESRFMIVHYFLDEPFERADFYFFCLVWTVFFRDHSEFGRVFSYKTLKETMKKMGYDFCQMMDKLSHRKNLIVAETKKSMVA